MQVRLGQQELRVHQKDRNPSGLQVRLALRERPVHQKDRNSSGLQVRLELRVHQRDRNSWERLALLPERPHLSEWQV